MTPARHADATGLLQVCAIRRDRLRARVPDDDAQGFPQHLWETEPRQSRSAREA
jgi:hypothetical protein